MERVAPETVSKLTSGAALGFLQAIPGAACLIYTGNTEGRAQRSGTVC